MKVREDLALSLLDIAMLIERRLDSSVSTCLGVSFREFRLLRQLSGFPNHAATRVDLAAAAAMTPSGVTRALKPLEKIGYVTTTKDDRDARKSLATLTPAGVELLANAQGIVDDALGTLPLDGAPHVAISSLHDALLATPNRSCPPIR